jgi:hypothetical protein
MWQNSTQTEKHQLVAKYKSDQVQLTAAMYYVITESINQSNDNKYGSILGCCTM